MCRWHCDVWQGSDVTGFYALQLCKRVLVTIKPSVRLFVRHTRVLWQNERKFCQHCYTVWKIHSSSFLTRRMVDGGRPLLPEILDQTDPSPFKNGDFPIFAHSASALTCSENVQLHVSRLELSNEPKMNSVRCPKPPKGTQNAKWPFSYKNGLFSKKICYKFSLCENFLLQGIHWPI